MREVAQEALVLLRHEA
jgi:vacuolar-type H+-ATPase subunit I/STV1